jgi:opacity protein-like surface antigen
MPRLRTLLALILLLQPAAALALQAEPDADPAAQEGNSTRSLDGVHCIALSAGLLTDLTATTSVSQGGTTVRGEAEGLLLSLDYSYGLNPDFAAQVSVGVLDADATVSTTGSTATVESATITAVQFGVKYRPEGITRHDSFRPYASVAVGPVVGHGTFVQAGPITSAESFSESAFGARIGAGVDVLLSKRFALGLGVAYRLVGDFDRRVGSRDNYSSPEAFVSFGVLFGGG